MTIKQILLLMILLAVLIFPLQFMSQPTGYVIFEENEICNLDLFNNPSNYGVPDCCGDDSGEKLLKDEFGSACCYVTDCLYEGDICIRSGSIHPSGLMCEDGQLS